MGQTISMNMLARHGGPRSVFVLYCIFVVLGIFTIVTTHIHPLHLSLVSSSLKFAKFPIVESKVSN